MAGFSERAKRLGRLLDEMDRMPDASYLESLKGQFQSLEQRVNLLEANLRSDPGDSEPVRTTLGQLAATLQSTVGLLQSMEASFKRHEETMGSVKERLDKLERTVRSLSIKAA